MTKTSDQSLTKGSKRAGELLSQHGDENKKIKTEAMSSATKTTRASKHIETLLKAKLESSSKTLQLQDDVEQKRLDMEKSTQAYGQSQEELETAKQSGLEIKEQMTRLVKAEIDRIKKARKFQYQHLEMSQCKLKSHGADLAFMEKNYSTLKRQGQPTTWNLHEIKTQEHVVKKIKEATVSDEKAVEELDQKAKLYERTLKVLDKDREVMEAALAIAMLVKEAE